MLKKNQKEKSSKSHSMNMSKTSNQRDCSPKKNSPTMSRSRSPSPKKKEKRRKNTFRAEGVHWILTFPQCSISKEEAMKNITSKENLSVKAVVVSRELHADGHYHLHIIIVLNEKLRTRRQDYWDFVGGKHGDYQVIKYPKKAYAYVTKEDKDPMIFGTVPNIFLESKKSKSDIAAEMIQSSSSLQPIIQAMPGFAMLNLTKMIAFRSYVTNVCSTKSLRHLDLPIKYDGDHASTLYIIEWLNGNLLTSRRFKQRQLWIYGPPNTLKTSLLIKLNEYLRVYPVPLGEDFYDTYDDDAYDLIIADEYKAQKTITFLNDFLQGGMAMNLRIKGGQIMKRKNLPAIFCSNHSISEAYHKANAISISALKERFSEVYVDTPLDLDAIQFEKPKVDNEKEEEVIEESDNE